MKYTMLFAALWCAKSGPAQTTYNFNVGTGSWTDPMSWNPARVNPKPDDILQFNADALVAQMPDSEIIGALKIQHTAQVHFTTTAVCRLDIRNPGPSAFATDPGSLLELAGNVDIHISLGTGSKGTINGTIRFIAAAHRLEVTDSAGLYFEAGSSFIAGPGFTGNAFGTTHLNSVVFKPASSYFSRDGGNPFGAVAPASVTVFENGSFFYQQQAIGLSLGGRKYGFLQTEANINLSLFGSVNDVNIQNDLVIHQGYFIFHPNTTHAGSFKIYGNIVQHAASILDIGNTNMTGSVQLLGNNPTIGAGDGNGACNIYNLTLNCAGNAVAGRQINVNGNVSFLKGKIKTDSVHTLILGSNASIQSPVNAYGQTNEGWEQSFVDGPMQLIVSGITKKMAPVGNGNVFAPVGIEKANSNLATYFIQYFSQPFADITSVNHPSLDHVSQVEYWKIMSTDMGTDAKITLSWRPGSFVGNTISERTDLALAHFVDMGFGMMWNPEGDSPAMLGDQNYGYLESDNYITQLSEMTLASKSRFNTLPLTQIKLLATESEGIVHLNWDPHPEMRFYLQRSQRSGPSIFKCLAAGTSDFKDTLPEPGDYFYRLNLVDPAGLAIYSPLVRISFRDNRVFSLYPNPCVENLFIKFSTQSSRPTLELVNSQGQFLQTLQLTGNAVNTTWLNKGKYYIRYRVKNKVVTKAFIRL